VTPYETTVYSTLPTLALHFATALRHLITRFKRNFCNSGRYKITPLIFAWV